MQRRNSRIFTAELQPLLSSNTDQCGEPCLPNHLACPLAFCPLGLKIGALLLATTSLDPRRRRESTPVVWRDSWRIVVVDAEPTNRTSLRSRHTRIKCSHPCRHRHHRRYSARLAYAFPCSQCLAMGRRHRPMCRDLQPSTSRAQRTRPSASKQEMGTNQR